MNPESLWKLVNLLIQKQTMYVLIITILFVNIFIYSAHSTDDCFGLC